MGSGHISELGLPGLGRGDEQKESQSFLTVVTSDKDADGDKIVAIISSIRRNNNYYYFNNN